MAPIYIGIEVGLKVASLPTICKALGVRLAGQEEAKAGPAPTNDLSPVPNLPGHDAAFRAAQILAARRRPQGGCLCRSLLLGHRFRKFRPVLRIGILPNKLKGAHAADSTPASLSDSALAAHAWLEIGGIALEDVGGLVALRPAKTP